MPTPTVGVTSRLISVSAQNNSTWTQRTADISDYIGCDARLVVLYQSGSSFTGDAQLDTFNIGGLPIIQPPMEQPLVALLFK
jgi:hypothetical protein